MTAAEVVPSPHSTVAVCVSETPGSLNEVVTLSGAPTATGSTGPLRAATVGATFSTTTATLALGLGSKPGAPRYRGRIAGVPLSAKVVVSEAWPAASRAAVWRRPSIANSTLPLGTPNADSTVAVTAMASPSRAEAALAESV